MSDDIRNQMYNELNLRETEDLLEIWYTNDREGWSDTAYEVIQEILIKRLGEIPQQEVVVDEETEAEDPEDDGLPEWEAKLLDDENQPEYYDTIEVLELRDNINKTAKAVIVIYGLTNLMSFSYYSFLIRSYFRVAEEYNLMVDVIVFVLTCLAAVVAVAITYYPLKALTHILRILMEMEFNSRKRVQPNSLVE